MKLIIDKNYMRYQPLFLASKVNLFEYDLSKHEKAYIYLDTLDNIEFLMDFPNIILVSDKDRIMTRYDLDIVKVSHSLNSEESIDEAFSNKFYSIEYMKVYGLE